MEKPLEYGEILILILKLLLIFMIGTIIGWGIETFWRRFFGKARRWINPGFLNGPWLPLYGFGAIVLYIICENISHLYIRMISFIVILTILEYVAGLIFIGHFKIQLWDYSKNKGNVKGLICPLYSFLWMILGLLFSYTLFPLLQSNITHLLRNLELSFFIGIFMGIFSVDMWQSFNLASRIKTFVNESEEKWHVDFENFKLELRDRVESGMKNRTHFLLPFYGELGSGLKERLNKHRSDKIKIMGVLRKRDSQK